MSRLPEGWKNLQLGSICEFTQGIQIPFAELIQEYKEGYIRYLYIRDFFSDKDKCYVKDIYPHKIMKKEDIMIVNTGNTAGSVYSGAEGVLSNNAFKLSFDNQILNRDFLYQFLKSYIFGSYIKRLFNSAGQPHVGHKNIALVPIKLPPLEEQKKIAEILSTVDEKIAFVDKSIEETQTLKKGLMQKLLTEGIAHTEFKESEIGRIPVEWEVVKLPILTNKITSGGTPSRKKPEYFKNGTINWIKTGELRDNYIYNSSEKITEEAVSNSSAKIFPVGTLLIAMYGATIGRTAYLKTACSTNQACCAIIFNKEKADTHFYWQYILFIKENLISMGSGAGQPNISQGIIKDLLVINPPLEEQKQIAKILSTVDEKLEILREKKKSYERLKKGLMQKLLTGEVRR